MRWGFCFLGWVGGEGEVWRDGYVEKRTQGCRESHILYRRALPEPNVAWARGYSFVLGGDGH